MGCDIHIFVECLMSVDDENIWTNIDKWSILPKFRDESFEPKYECEHVYNGRDYNLFPVLANVRNYEEVKYISKPRGFPNNVSNLVKNFSDHGDYDCHSHSWTTLYELKEFKKPAQKEITKLSNGWSHQEYDILNPIIDISEEKINIFGVHDSNMRIVFFFDS